MKLFRDKSQPLVTQPHKSVWDDCVYVGHNNSRWLYMVLPDIPLVFEDPETRLGVGKVLHDLLAGVGELSREPLGALIFTGRNREFHVVTHLWFDNPPIPDTSTPEHVEFLDEVFDFMCPAKATWIGVRLWASKESEERPNVIAQGIRTVAGVLGFDTDDMSAYNEDYRRVQRLMVNYGCRPGTVRERQMLTNWYSGGREGDFAIIPQKDRIVIDDSDDIEFTAVTDFKQHQFWPRYSTWITDSISHAEGAVVVSVRGRLETMQVTRRRLSARRRRLNAEISEELAAQQAGGIDHSESVDKASYLRQVDDIFASDQTAVIAGGSIVMARKARPAEKTFVDWLRSVYKIEARNVTHQQMRALKETLPTTTDRVSDCDHSMLIPVIAYSGIRAFSQLGDADGALMGFVLPDLVPCYLSSRAGSALGNQSGMTVVVADSGSGKSMLLQMLAMQYAQLGEQVFFVNPKIEDDLSPLVKLTNGRLINISEVEPGAFDPWRFARTPEQAAEFLADYLLEAFPEPEAKKKARLRAGLNRGARAGARCAMEALQYIDDQDYIETVEQMCEGSALFRLGIGFQPQDPFSVRATLTLVQFDQGLNLPDSRKNPKDYDDGERLALAAQMLVTRGGLYALLRSKGGVMILDEAHRWLQNPETLNKIQQVGREGRSQQVMPILATQRMGDFDSSDLSSYITRVMVMKINDPREAEHCLRICGLTPTPDLVAWLQNAGPKNEKDDGKNRPPLCLHMDRKGRHSGVMLGPWPAQKLLAFSTNPFDRETRAALEAGEAVDPENFPTSVSVADVELPSMPDQSILPPALEPAGGPEAEPDKGTEPPRSALSSAPTSDVGAT